MYIYIYKYVYIYINIYIYVYIYIYYLNLNFTLNLISKIWVYNKTCYFYICTGDCIVSWIYKHKD